MRKLDGWERPPSSLSSLPVGGLNILSIVQPIFSFFDGFLIFAARLKVEN